MANFTSKDVQLLRKKTGVGIMDCKEALSEAEGDIERAVDILREKGIAKAAKKADRVAAQGIVFAKVDGNSGVLVEVNSETDFVARNDKFKDFVDEVASTILKNKPANCEELQKCKMVKTNLMLSEAVQEVALVLGEKISIRRFVLMDGVLSTYVHGVGNIGVMVKFETDVAEKPDFSEYGKNIAMQIAAAYPKYIDSSKVPSDVLEKEKHILKQQMADSEKSEEIIQRIVNGKLNRFYEECCLLNQKYVKDSDLTVEKYTEKTAKELGGHIKIIDFVRMECGEGIEENLSDFAQEVASMLN